MSSSYVQESPRRAVESTVHMQGNGGQGVASWKPGPKSLPPCLGAGRRARGPGGGSRPWASQASGLSSFPGRPGPAARRSSLQDPHACRPPGLGPPLSLSPAACLPWDRPPHSLIAV